ncbi:MAG: uracil-DNA glycosylase family protein [Sphingomonadaceae bacterium]
MGAEHQNFEIAAAESLLGWWCDAGVDCAFSEMPFAWLVQAKAAPSQIAPPVEAALPDTIEAFTTWLLSGDIPGAGPPRQRLAPAGDCHAQLMILTDFPERDDLAAGRWMAGGLETVFEAMLSALGTDRASVYMAPLTPSRPDTGMIAAEAMTALAKIARQHIALIRPAQLWLMGPAASRAILGMDDAAAKGRLHSVNLDGATIAAIATAHPRTFQDSRNRKAAAWTEMQRLLKKDLP